MKPTSREKEVLVLGAGGFIGFHLTKRLKEQGCFVTGVDLKYPEFVSSPADHFIIADLRKESSWIELSQRSYQETYQLAANMGGAGFIFSGENDADIMRDSLQINLHLLEYLGKTKRTEKIFYSSSACIYPLYNQLDPNNPICSEESAYPAAPDSEYGWEKLFSERLFQSFSRNYGVQVRIARFHNIFGMYGTWKGGREKAPAALCRKISEAENGGQIEIWGDGTQTRSFLYIDECIDGIQRLMKSNYHRPLNIGSSEMITIQELALCIAAIANKKISIKNIPGPLGVKGRCSDNSLINTELGWAPKLPLRIGLEKTYGWIDQQVKAHRQQNHALKGTLKEAIPL